MENPTFYALIFAAFCIAVAISSLLLPRILMIALRKKLVSLPNSCRDIHVKPIPRLGGVAFFPNILFTVSFIIAVSILIGQPYPEIGLSAEFLLAICAVVVLYLTGVADDLVGVPYKYKFVAQILCSLSLPIAGLYVEGLDGFLFIGALPMWIGIPFAMLIIVFVVNTINLVDGIDGLASGISMVVLIALGCAFMRYGMWLYTLIAFTTVGTLIPFFYFNVFGGKKKGRNLFMGDTGSLTLGFIIAWLSLKYAFGTPESP
ncbi:MAG: undecaprenyl/decaprenyl-phosphate alpha-N-acetylglucosaminyl 1-phosphate transferase, partial [Prevotellaceae bacterium]|nr:undecaprenyl/decaprenyl-phosphate alpha-N-acetylglucosaminyl 1-phosphate transferase [Prevotellaceae bacterium]